MFLQSLLGDRHVSMDLLRAFLASLRKVPPTKPERCPDVPEDVTPIEILERECRELGVELHDLRDLPRDQVYDWREWGWPGDKSRAKPHGKRAWNNITAICLHTFGVSNIGWKRFLGVPCHAGVASNGDVVLCHYLWQYLWHGDAANKFSAGIEVAGVSDFDNPVQIKAARALIRYIEAERQANVDPAGKYIGQMAVMGHSMATKKKPNCPGPVLWQELGSWAIETGLLRLGPVVGTGNPIR